MKHFWRFCALVLCCFDWTFGSLKIFGEHLNRVVTRSSTTHAPMSALDKLKEQYSDHKNNNNNNKGNGSDVSSESAEYSRHLKEVLKDEKVN